MSTKVLAIPIRLTIALSAKPFGQEEAGESHVDEDALVERLAKNAADEGVPAELIGLASVGVRIGVQLLLFCGQP